jgi:hypothetical protein
MAELAVHGAGPNASPQTKPKLDGRFNPISEINFFGLLAAGLL